MERISREKKKTRQVRSCSFNLHSGQKLIIIHKNIINQTLVNYSIWQLLLFLSLKNYHLFVRFFLVFVCGSHRQELNVLIQRNVDRVFQITIHHHIEILRNHLSFFSQSYVYVRGVIWGLWVKCYNHPQPRVRGHTTLGL